MTAYEKADLLKETIRKLYEDEGRSISYINRLLGIDRHTLSTRIREWKFLQINQEQKKIRQFLSEYKEQILASIKSGYNMRSIEQQFHVGHAFYAKVAQYDDDIANAMKNTIKVDGNYTVYPDEAWKPVLGYPDYEVSDCGRVRHNNTLVKPILNKLHGRYYVGMIDKQGKRHNLLLARVVAHHFCEGYSNTRNTVNHKDGDPTNNIAANLEWVSQSENNKHAYDQLNRPHNVGKPLKFVIVYQNQYRFKTIAAFARFINKSETQARRWVEEPEKHNIQIISK